MVDPKVTAASVGKLAEDVEDATAAAQGATAAARDLVVPVTDLLQQLRSDQTWRHWIVVTLTTLGVSVVVAMAIGFWMMAHLLTIQHQNHKILTQIDVATGPAAQVRSSEQIGQVIRIVVGMVDCNTRGDLAQVLHVTLPATTTCPAVSG